MSNDRHTGARETLPPYAAQTAQSLVWARIAAVCANPDVEAQKGRKEDTGICRYCVPAGWIRGTEDRTDSSST